MARVRYVYREEIITKDMTWRVPAARDQQFEVTIYGGGGSGSIDTFNKNIVSGAGGGSGYVASATLTLPVGESIDISIADGGQGATGTTAHSIDGFAIGKTGGSSFFGKYLFAAGGLGGFASTGGDGYFDGGNSGEDGEGSVGSDRYNSQLSNVTSISGGGGSGANAIGRGGSGNVASGDGGAASGGAGAIALGIDKEGNVERHIGSGGPGLCIIKYYKKV